MIDNKTLDSANELIKKAEKVNKLMSQCFALDNLWQNNYFSVRISNRMTEAYVEVSEETAKMIQHDILTQMLKIERGLKEALA
jgi:hypothetical protein